jgi:hypothetical protein
LAQIDAPVESHAVRMLTLIESVLEARFSGTPDGPIEQYSIEQRTVMRFSTEKLHALRAKYASEVGAEMNPNGPIGSVKFAFPLVYGGFPWSPTNLRYRGLA